MKRRFFSLIMALVFLLAMPLQALAAQHDVYNANDIMSAVDSDTDAEVVLQVQQDITDHVSVYGSEGQKYTINGNGNSLGDVYVSSAEVEINADITNGLIVDMDSDVSVNGDIQGKDTDDALVVNSSNVVVTGNIDGTVSVHDSNLEVTGNIFGTFGTEPDAEGNLEFGTMNDPDGYSDGRVGLTADSSTVYVDGTVGGGIAYGSFAYAGAGIYANNSDVTVTGHVFGAPVVANPEVETYVQSKGGNGLEATNGSKVTVGGDVLGGSTNGYNGIGGGGVGTDGTSTVVVKGDIRPGGGGENGTDGEAEFFVSYGEPAYGESEAEKTFAPMLCVTGGGSIWTPAGVSGTTARMRQLTQVELSQVLEGCSGTVTIDCTAWSGFDALELPEATLQAIMDAVDSLEVVFAGGSVTVNDAEASGLAVTDGFVTVSGK